MRKTLLTSLLGATILATGIPASAAPRLRAQEHGQLHRMRKADSLHKKWSGANLAGTRTGARKSIAPDFTTPRSDEFQYLFGPDGTEWYAICNYDTETVALEGGYATEELITGYTFTVYDSKFNEVGTIRDKIKFEEDETRCAGVMLDVTVTKKFFNSDDKYEVMVSVSMNTPDYTVRTRTLAYTLQKDSGEEYSTPITVIPGYPVDAVDVETISWYEDYYITFLTETWPDPDTDYPSQVDYLADCKQVLTTYRKASYNTTEPQQVIEHSISLLNLPGDQMSSPMMLCKGIDGLPVFAYARYEKSFFVDPTGMGGIDDVTPDNHLIIDIYKMKDTYTKEMELSSTTRIATVQDTEDDNVYCTFYGIGNLMYDKDVDFDHYTDDGRPAFVVSTDQYLLNDDDNYNSSYYVYDADGNRIKTIAEDTFNYVMLSNLPGQEPQAMFIHTADDMTFEFVDLYSCKTVVEIDQMYRGNGLSASIDRVATANGYVYATALTNGIADENGSIYAPVCWIGTDGELIRIDKIPTGENVELAQIYMSSDALNPYVFNTDSDLEYLLLVKRRTSEGYLQEELLVSSPVNGVLHSFGPDDEKGYLWVVYLIGGQNPELIISYNDDDKFTTDSYALPFSKFTGGSGSADDPYLIASAGDFMQIKSNPNAHYRLTADIDCGGLTIYTVKDFFGSVDGAGHTIRNLALYGKDNISLFGYTHNASFKDINIYNCLMELEGDNTAAVLVSNPVESEFDNIHVRQIKATGDSFTGGFGGITGRTWTRTSLKTCEVAGADINLPQAENVGGLVSEIRTGSSINASAFSGKIIAGSTLGGIVGTTTTGDEVISGCHVDAMLKAKNTVGGIVGFLDRSTVTGNYVEGTIEAYEPYKWTKAFAAGGVVGELEGDWEGNSDCPVSKNLVGISSITVPALDLTEDYPHQLATVHRVVGRSSYNAEPEVERYDKDDNPIYKDKVIYEYGIRDNLVISDLAVIDQDFAEKTLEGTSVDKYDIDTEMLEEKLGFKYGNDASAPWNLQAWYAYDPSLYFENTLFMPASDMTVEMNQTFDVEVAVISCEPVSVDEVMDGFMCDFDESILEMTGNMTYDNNVMRIEFKALVEGTTSVSVAALNGNAVCAVKVLDPAMVKVESVADACTDIVYSNATVRAPGCIIRIFDATGRIALQGSDNVDTSSLAKGIYVAAATDTEGKTSSIKFVK